MARKKKQEEPVEEIIEQEEPVEESGFSEEEFDEIRELAGEGNSLEEIAILMGVSVSELNRNEDCARAIELGKVDQKANLRHWQMQAAQSGNVTMLVWLGKVILGQREETEVSSKLMREDDELTKSLTGLAKEMDAEHGK